MKSYNDTQKEICDKRIRRILNPESSDARKKSNTTGKVYVYSKENKRIIKKYYTHLIKNYQSPHTLVMYLQQARNLMIDVDKDVSKLTKKDIDNYLIKITSLAPRTQYERKKFLFIFLPWVKNKSPESIKKSVLKDIKLIKPKKDLLEEDVLLPGDVLAMIKCCRSDRDRAIISLLYETGARKGEFLRLKIRHIIRKEHCFEINIPKGKTTSRKNWLVDSVPYLTTWLESHPNSDNPNANLWINQGAWKGRSLGEDGLKRLIKVCGKTANIQKRCYPHGFRHARASFFAKLGKNEDFLRRWFGWSKTSRMPSHYVHTFSRDTEKEYLADMGIVEKVKANKKERETLKSKHCVRCKTKDIPTHFQFCPRCFLALDVEAAQRFEALTRKSGGLSKGLLTQDISIEKLKSLIEEIIKDKKN